MRVKLASDIDTPSSRVSPPQARRTPVPQILTGVSWQAELADIVHGGTVVRVEGEADQHEDQGLQKAAPEMQVVKHVVGCVCARLLWSRRDQSRGRGLYITSSCTVCRPDGGRRRGLRRGSERCVLLSDRLFPYCVQQPLVRSLTRSLTRRPSRSGLSLAPGLSRTTDPGPARATECHWPDDDRALAVVSRFIIPYAAVTLPSHAAPPAAPSCAR